MAIWSIPGLETSGLWKPTLHLSWPPRPDFAHPEWRWVWAGMTFLAPLWEGGGDPIEVFSGTRATRTGTVVWSRRLVGEAGDFDGASSGSFWQWSDLSVPAARPITSLLIFSVRSLSWSYQPLATNARVAGTHDAWSFFCSHAGNASVRFRHSNANDDTVNLGAATNNAWYAVAATSDRDGGIPKGAMLRLDTRDLVTATGIQGVRPTQSRGPAIAISGYTGGNASHNGWIALSAWLPGVSWSERQILAWVHDPFAFLIPARRVWSYFPGLIFQPTVTPWEAAARVSQSTVMPWEALGAVSGPDSAVPWEALGVFPGLIFQPTVTPWEAAARVSQSTVMPWEALDVSGSIVSGRGWPGYRGRHEARR